MVFSSSVPAYLDPSNWHPQRPESGREPDQNAHQVQVPLLPPPPPPVTGGGGGGTTSKPSLMSDRARLAKLPLPEVALKCPRCESTNTKFCYFNNYNLSQPRHFCKTCRRYWTRGGALRNVPVGGGCRRNNKRSSKVGNNRSKSPATNSSPSHVGHSRCITTENMNHLGLPPPKLPFLPSLHHLTDYRGAGTAVGLTFGDIQTAAGNNNDLMINNGSNNLEWRMQQLQPPPFPFSEGPNPGMYQFENDGASNYVAGGVTADYFGCKNVDSAAGITQVDGGINNMEENPQGLNLSKRFMGNISATDNQFWGISNPWSNASSSSNNHVL